MKPLIRETQDKKYIEIIGHYDNPILCAKLTVLADLYAVEHKEGYALFKVEDYDKLSFIDDKLEFAGNINESTSLTDLTGTTWLLNEEQAPAGTPTTYNIFFTSNSNSYNSLTFGKEDGERFILYGESYAFSSMESGWLDEQYRTITITGGTDATNSTLISWLEANATQVIISRKILKLGNKIINKINNKKIKSFNDIDVMCGKTS